MNKKPDLIEPATDALPPIDQLMTRPDSEPLPTRLDPAGPEAHGYPVDPKLAPESAKNAPAAGDINRSA